MFCSPDNGIDNIVGVEVMGDPDDGHEDNKQDHDDQTHLGGKTRLHDSSKAHVTILGPQEVFF